MEKKERIAKLYASIVGLEHSPSIDKSTEEHCLLYPGFEVYWDEIESKFRVRIHVFGRLFTLGYYTQVEVKAILKGSRL